MPPLMMPVGCLELLDPGPGFCLLAAALFSSNFSPTLSWWTTLCSLGSLGGAKGGWPSQALLWLYLLFLLFCQKVKSEEKKKKEKTKKVKLFLLELKAKVDTTPQAFCCCSYSVPVIVAMIFCDMQPKSIAVEKTEYKLWKTKYTWNLAQHHFFLNATAGTKWSQSA